MSVFEEWLKQLDEELKLGGRLALDADQRCFLMFDEKLLIEIGYEPSAQTFHFQGALDSKTIPQQTFCDALLEHNLGWKDTDGAAFGLQLGSEKTQLVQSLPVASCDYALFNRSLEHFVNTFEYWIDHIETLKSSETNEKPAGILV